MIPAMDDLLAEGVLTFTPLSGTIDVESVAAAITGIGFAYRDEIAPSAFAIFSEEDARDACKAARRANPSSTFPYVLLVTVRPDVVIVYPAVANPELRTLSMQLIEWLRGTYACRIENEFGTDMSEPRPPKEESPMEESPENTEPVA